MNLFHRHNFKPVETKYPVRVAGHYDYDDGTAVYWKCDCGKAKVTEHQLQWVVWHDTIVHILK
jgi:hypothetical protein